MSIELITKNKKFKPLFWTQFLGALNDNLLKNALVVLIAYKGISLGGLTTQSLVAMAGAIFILPFFFLSPISGQISDTVAKFKIVRRVKEIELLIMILSGVGFYFSHYELLFVCLFLMGIHSTLFGPVKYSMIPELVPENQLLSANAMIEVGTFLAILIGTILGGVLISIENGPLYLISALIFCSLLGIFFGYRVPQIPPLNARAKIQLNPFPEIYRNHKELKKHRDVKNAIYGISWFWFFGAALLSLLPLYAKNILFCGEHVVSLFLGLFTVGIAVGSVICDKLSFERVEIGLVPLGSLGLTLFLVDLGLASYGWPALAANANLLTLQEFIEHSGSYRIIIDLFLISISGGIFTVPLYTLMQQRAMPSHRSRVVAFNNILNSIYMVASAILIMIFSKFGLGTLEMFIIFGLLNLLVAIRIYFDVPEFTLRFLSWCLSHMMYRLKCHGLKNIPQQGSAILICNHVSFIDWLLISSEVKRPIRFVMYYKYARFPLLKYFFRHAGVILIAGANENAKVLEHAFESISKALKKGELVCIFPEGNLTTDGNLRHFKPGIRQILEKDPAIVIPMVLKNMWGSMFSKHPESTVLKGPRKFLSHVELKIGEPIEHANVQIRVLENKLSEMLSENF